MRKIAILAAFAAITSATTVFAQTGGPPPGRGRGPGGGGMMMDRMLLEGITLSEAQQAKLQELRKAERDRHDLIAPICIEVADRNRLPKGRPVLHDVHATDRGGI